MTKSEGLRMTESEGFRATRGSFFNSPTAPFFLTVSYSLNGCQAGLPSIIAFSHSPKLMPFMMVSV